MNVNPQSSKTDLLYFLRASEHQFQKNSPPTVEYFYFLCTLKEKENKKTRMSSAAMSHQPRQLYNTLVFPFLCSPLQMKTTF